MRQGTATPDERIATMQDRLAQLAALADREADRVALLLTDRGRARPHKRKGKTKGRSSVSAMEIAHPTPEQAARAPYDLQAVRDDGGQLLGQAWRRLPWFESLAKREAGEAARDRRQSMIGADELTALHFYRNSFEAASRSEMRCALDIIPGNAGPGGGPRDLPPAILIARANLARCEANMGATLPTMRAVALDDRTYAAVAMDRFGTREQSWYDDKAGILTTRPAPRSNRHPGIIRAEFLAGLQALVEAVRERVRTG